MLGRVIIIIVGVVTPILIPYLFPELFGSSIILYVYVYFLVLISVSLILSLFLIVTWSGERRNFMICFSLTLVSHFLGLIAVLNFTPINVSYEEIFLRFAKELSLSIPAISFFIGAYFPLLIFGIWKSGREVAFLRVTDVFFALFIFLIFGTFLALANLYSKLNPEIKEVFLVNSSADILLIFIYALLTRIYSKTESKSYYGTVLTFFIFNFLCDSSTVAGFTAYAIPVVFYALGFVSVISGFGYIYTRDIKILSYEKVLEEKDRITELYKKVSELQEALAIINRMLRHDVKNKLQIILGYIEIYLTERSEEYLHKAIKAVEETNEYINKIRSLEVAISSDKSVLKPKNIREVVEDVLKFYQIPFTVQGSCFALVDEAIYSVIDNIVNNAIKHGKTDKIEVQISEVEDECEIRIIDYGIGIPLGIKRRIFEENFTLDPQTGSGIGLYVVKKVVERYGGRVWVEDTKPRGATFVIRLKSTRNQAKFNHLVGA
ncbi:MAG: HAMP domain-containing sensor histidine kinase [Archaeoglobaceae archaeon]